MPGRKGPIDEARRLLRLAWPVVLAQLGMVFMGAVDLWMVAPLGEAATASLGLGNTYSFGLVILGLGAATGIDPLVTQAYGAGHPKEAGAAALHGLVLVALLSVPLTALHLVSPTVLGALGQPPELLPLADTYCSINALGIPAFFAFAVVRQWLQGDGVMRPAMLVIGAGNGVNLLADALLVGPYGVAGVAWSTVIVRWSMLGALVWLTLPVLRRSWPDNPSVRGSDLARLATIALPVSLQNGLEIWAFSGATIIAGFLGSTAVAAHVSAINIVALAFMAATGLSAAAATRVGNRVGAGESWTGSAVLSMVLVSGVMSFTGFLFLVFPEAIGRTYSSDPHVVSLVAAVLPIGAAFGLFDGVQVVAFGILRGLGDTRVPSLFNLIAYWTLGIPIGTWLALRTELGLIGVWLGLALALVVVSGLLGLRIGWHARAARPPHGSFP